MSKAKRNANRPISQSFKTLPKKQANPKKLRMWRILAAFALCLIVLCLATLIAMGEL